MLFMLPGSASAVSGTCSDHGGVDCSAMADWDGSAVCNDGWRDSSETFSSAQECQNLHHSCTVAEFNQINQKYNLDEKLKAVSDIDNQIIAFAEPTVTSATDVNTLRQQQINQSAIYTKIVALQSQLYPLEADYWNASNQATRECWALGDAEYEKMASDIYAQYHSQIQANTTQTVQQSTTDACVTGGIKNSHQSGSSCVCDSGYYQYGQQCYTNADFCPLVLGSGGIAYDATQCACKTGYTLDSVNKYCVQNAAASVAVANSSATPVQQDTPVPTVTKRSVVQPKTEIPIMSVVPTTSATVSIATTTPTTTVTPSVVPAPEPSKSSIIRRFFSWIFSFL